MINFLFWTVLPPEASKVDQTHKFYDFFDLTQFFQIRQKSVLVEMNNVDNVIYNNFEYHDQPFRLHRSPLGVGKIFPIRKIQRLQLFQMTLYTVLIKIKVVRNSVLNKFELHNQLSRIHRFLSKTKRL